MELGERTQKVTLSAEYRRNLPLIERLFQLLDKAMEEKQRLPVLMLLATRILSMTLHETLTYTQTMKMVEQKYGFNGPEDDVAFIDHQELLSGVGGAEDVSDEDDTETDLQIWQRYQSREMATGGYQTRIMSGMNNGQDLREIFCLTLQVLRMTADRPNWQPEAESFIMDNYPPLVKCE